jgi:hypothetical protein
MNRKKQYYLNQNIYLAPIHLMEALGYVVKLSFTGGMSYYKDGKQVLPGKFPSEQDLELFVYDLNKGLSVKEARENFLSVWKEN